MKAVYTLVSTPNEAQRAVDALRGASRDLGFDAGKIIVLSGEPIEGVEFAEQHARGYLFPVATLSGIIGGFCGYFLTTLTQHAYGIPTGGMPIAPTWTNGIIVYELTMLGAIIGTLIGLLVTASLPAWKRARFSDPEIWTGKILVGVEDPPDSATGELSNRLRQAGAAEIKQFEDRRS